MEFTQQDRDELYHIWMSKKAKMRLIQMEVVKTLGLTQNEFSDLLRGNARLNINFINQFCQIMHVDPKQALPSFRNGALDPSKQITLKTRVSIEGEIQRAYVEGNEVIIEYVYKLD